MILLMQCSIVAFATPKATVSADKISLTETEPTLIPIKIAGNSGIMGFKITVEYPVDKMQIKSVSRGEITTKGNFNTNLGINDGKFDVLWNHTENVTGDGTMFVISAQAETEITKDTEIKLSFSQSDTFNEAWEDVALDCKNITISAKYIETTRQETTTQNGESTTKAPPPIDSSQVVDATNTTLEQNGNKNLSEVTDKEKFVEDFNKNLEIITGTSEHNVADFESLVNLYNSAYEGNFITDVTNNVDQSDIQNAINDALKSVGASSIEEIKDKNKAEFVKKVEENLKEYTTEISDISEELETDNGIDIIDKLYKSTSDNNTQNYTNEEISNNHIVIIVLVIVILIAIIILCVVIIKKKKAK